MARDRYTSEQRAILGLWSIPGIGPRSLARLKAWVDLAALVDAPADWAGDAPLSQAVRDELARGATLAERAEELLARTAACGAEITLPDDPEYPENLKTIADRPEVLFRLGAPGPPRRRVALVGSRVTEGDFPIRARRFAGEVAAEGIGVISGGAEGVDRACHLGALDARGETWMFVGSALDTLDAAQEGLWQLMAPRGGVVWSELPPGMRASPQTFPRRNRLISGASDAVVVVRARQKSGSLITAGYGRKQGRPVLAIPAEVSSPSAAGSNELLREGTATACLSARDVRRAVGLERKNALPPEVRPRELPDRLGEVARQVYRRLGKRPYSLDALIDAIAREPAEITCALVELELSGLAIQLPGRMYEKV